MKRLGLLILTIAIATVGLCGCGSKEKSKEAKKELFGGATAANKNNDTSKVDETKEVTLKEVDVTIVLPELPIVISGEDVYGHKDSISIESVEIKKFEFFDEEGITIKCIAKAIEIESGYPVFRCRIKDSNGIILDDESFVMGYGLKNGDIVKSDNTLLFDLDTNEHYTIEFYL